MSGVYDREILRLRSQARSAQDDRGVGSLRSGDDRGWARSAQDDRVLFTFGPGVYSWTVTFVQLRSGFERSALRLALNCGVTVL